MAVLADSEQTVLRPTADECWAKIFDDWIGGTRRRARNLALMMLYEQCGWDFNALCLAFDMKKPAISLAISRTRQQLIEHLQGLPDDRSDIDDRRQLQFTFADEPPQDRESWQTYLEKSRGRKRKRMKAEG